MGLYRVTTIFNVASKELSYNRTYKYRKDRVKVVQFTSYTI